MAIIRARVYSCLDMIFNFLFSLETNPQIMGCVLCYYVHICYFFLEPPSLENNLYIMLFMSKQWASLCWTVLITRCPLHRYTGVSDAKNHFHEGGHLSPGHFAPEEVQREQEITFCAAKRREYKRAQKCSKYQPIWVKAGYLPCVTCWDPGIKVSRTQGFKKMNPTEQCPKLWFQQHFLCWNKGLWVRL